MAKVCIVIPVLNEELVVEEMHRRLRRVSESIACELEFVFVDDGSTDSTLDRLLTCQGQDPRLTVIKLSRNWGQQSAYNAGLDYAREADAVILLDGDLEDPPELIPRLVEAWTNGADVVFTLKRRRVQSFARRILTEVYYRALNATSEVKLERQAGLFSLLDRKVVQELRRFPERNKSYPNLRSFVGFRQACIEYERAPRFAGEPRQTLRKLMRDGLNAIFSFSYLPMRALTVLGFSMVVLFALLSVFVLFMRVSGLEFWIFRQIPGWTSAILLILLVSSLQFVFLGLIGEYIARIFDEVRQRPYYIVEAVFPADAASALDRSEDQVETRRAAVSASRRQQ